MIVTVRKGSDPFKKYWWVILLVFGAVGGCVCLPLANSGAGAGSVSRGPGLQTEQSLDSQANPSGAPGSAVDLSMEGAYPKKKDGDYQQVSSLYQPPPEDAPVATESASRGAPIAAGSGPASYAAALKEVSRKTGAPGWGGASAQKGFTPPKGNFSSLSGLGGGGAAGSGANVSMGAFGASVAKVGFTTTRGLGDTASAQPSGSATPIMGALKAVQAQGLAALAQKSADASRALAGAGFDNSRGGSAISGGQGGSIDRSYANLDAAPMNLKPNDTSVNKYNYQPVPAAVAPMDTSQQQKVQIAMMVGSLLIGGLVGGTMGNVLSMGMMMMAATQGRSQNSGSNVAGQLPSSG